MAAVASRAPYFILCVPPPSRPNVPAFPFPLYSSLLATTCALEMPRAHRVGPPTAHRRVPPSNIATRGRPRPHSSNVTEAPPPPPDSYSRPLERASDATFSRPPALSAPVHSAMGRAVEDAIDSVGASLSAAETRLLRNNRPPAPAGSPLRQRRTRSTLVDTANEHGRRPSGLTLSRRPRPRSVEAPVGRPRQSTATTTAVTPPAEMMVPDLPVRRKSSRRGGLLAPPLDPLSLPMNAPYSLLDCRPALTGVHWSADVVRFGHNALRAELGDLLAALRTLSSAAANPCSDEAALAVDAGRFFHWLGAFIPLFHAHYAAVGLVLLPLCGTGRGVEMVVGCVGAVGRRLAQLGAIRKEAARPGAGVGGTLRMLIARASSSGVGLVMAALAAFTIAEAVLPPRLARRRDGGAILARLVTTMEAVASRGVGRRHQRGAALRGAGGRDSAGTSPWSTKRGAPGQDERGRGAIGGARITLGGELYMGAYVSAMGEGGGARWLRHRLGWRQRWAWGGAVTKYERYHRAEVARLT